MFYIIDNNVGVGILSLIVKEKSVIRLKINKINNIKFQISWLGSFISLDNKMLNQFLIALLLGITQF